MHHILRIRTAATVLAATAASALVLAGCTSSPDTGPMTSDVISADRCETNQSAGPVLFLTSFAYAASAGILDVVAADELGYFDDMCIDLVIKPGITNTQVVSAGTAQLAGLGGPIDVLTGVAQGADIVGIATYGNTSAIELITMADSGIEELADFEGRTVGYKGVVAPQFTAMFLDNGVDPDAINWVSVGYDPTILPDGQVEGLGAYKSNEPRVLEAAGHDVVEWDPAEYGIDSSFNTQIANGTFAAEYPTVVEDFLRATSKAFAWITESDANLDEALSWAEARSDAGYNVEMSKVRFQTEAALIAESQPEGTPLGTQTTEMWQAEADNLERFGLVTEPLDVSVAFSNQYVEAIFDGTDLIWGDGE